MQYIQIKDESPHCSKHVLQAVLSLFDGMSCGQIALNKNGFEIKEYYASEIDNHAINVTQDNYPKTKQVGSIVELKTGNLSKIDLLIGGSPCQSFSNAGLRNGFDGKSKLFYEYVRVLKETKPTYFLLENVKMKKEWQDIISKERFCKNMGVACLLYNHNDKHPILIQITNSFKRMFPDKIKELEHYMFFTNFGKLEEEYLSFEDFYDSLIK